MRSCWSENDTQIQQSLGCLWAGKKNHDHPSFMKEEKIILGLLLGATFERGKDTKMSKGG
jgi:hypothetical protein